jgi:hypothetical protein
MSLGMGSGCSARTQGGVEVPADALAYEKAVPVAEPQPSNIKAVSAHWLLRCPAKGLIEPVIRESLLEPPRCAVKCEFRPPPPGAKDSPCPRLVSLIVKALISHVGHGRHPVRASSARASAGSAMGVGCVAGSSRT